MVIAKRTPGNLEIFKFKYEYAKVNEKLKRSINTNSTFKYNTPVLPEFTANSIKNKNLFGSIHK